MFALAANAQIVTSTSQEIKTTYTQPQPQVNTKLRYVRAGFNVNTVTGEDVKEASAKPGYDVSLGFQKPLANVPFLYWGMEYGLTSRGFTAEAGIFGKYDYKYAQHGLKYVPFQIGYNRDFGKVSIDPHIGVCLNFWYYGFAKQEYNGNSATHSQYDWKDTDFCTWFSVYMPIGFGIWLNKRFNLDYTCEIAFTKIANADSKVRHLNHGIRLGMAF